MRAGDPAIVSERPAFLVPLPRGNRTLTREIPGECCAICPKIERSGVPACSPVRAGNYLILWVNLGFPVGDGRMAA